jgi:hypothetical protein
MSTPSVIAAVVKGTLIISLALHAHTETALAEGRAEDSFAIAIVQTLDTPIDGPVTTRDHKRAFEILLALGAPRTIVGAKCEARACHQTGERRRTAVWRLARHHRSRATFIFDHSTARGRRDIHKTTRPHIAPGARYLRLQRSRTELDFSRVTSKRQGEQNKAEGQ